MDPDQTPTTDAPDGEDLDWLRLPYEIARNGLSDLFDTGGTAVRRDGDEIVVIDAADGWETGRIPIWRFRRPDPALVADRLKALPPADVEVAAAAVAAGRLVITAPPTSDFVLVFVGEELEPFAAIARAACVAGWPPGVE